MVIAKNKTELLEFFLIWKYKCLILAFILIFVLPFFGIGQINRSVESVKIDSINKINIKKFNRKNLDSASNSANVEVDSFPPSKSMKSPRKASLYSALLPGLGQTYNGNYWKVPIIYSLFAGIYFLAEENNYKYHEFKTAYSNSLNGLETDPKFAGFQQSDLLQRKDYYKRNRDLNIIMGALFYLLNILDANVDANLMDYDISPDLSLKVKPEINNYFVNQDYSNRSNFGIKFVLSIR